MGTRQATLSMTYACKLEEDLDEIGTETAMQINPPFEYTTQKTERKNETVAQKPDVKNLIRLKFSFFSLGNKWEPATLLVLWGLFVEPQLVCYLLLFRESAVA